MFKVAELQADTDTASSLPQIYLLGAGKTFFLTCQSAISEFISLRIHYVNRVSIYAWCMNHVFTNVLIIFHFFSWLSHRQKLRELWSNETNFDQSQASIYLIIINYNNWMLFQCAQTIDLSIKETYYKIYTVLLELIFNMFWLYQICNSKITIRYRG
jgi:hypothetical protein